MSGLLRLSARAYGGILLLYPADLRRDFGPEMRELFGEDLDDAWQGSGAVWSVGRVVVRIFASSFGLPCRG